jgi:hypothetical protein
MGVAEGTAIESRLKGEASGLADKAKSMKALDQASRGHEEFRLQLDKEKTVELAGIKARRMVAEAQARIMGEAFKTANIDIVGGDGAFFDRMIHAISLGKSTDGFVEKSDTVSTLLSDYLDGSANLPADVKDILSRPKLSAGDVQNLTLSAFLAKLATGATDDDQEKISQLLETAKSLGLTQKNT